MTRLMLGLFVAAFVLPSCTKSLGAPSTTTRGGRFDGQWTGSYVAQACVGTGPASNLCDVLSRSPIGLELAQLDKHAYGTFTISGYRIGVGGTISADDVLYMDGTTLVAGQTYNVPSLT